ncbi:MAG: O-antigen ligase family protein [Patescibacteria group bacterium]|jgi:putative inorganic carbon (HCO3(-)) transporter
MSYLISFIVLILPAYLIRFSIGPVPTTLLEIIIYVVFLIGLWQAWKVGFKKIPWLAWLPAVLLLIAAIISTLVSPLKHEALGELKAFFIDPMMVVWLIFQFVKKEDLEKFIWAFSLSGLFVACHAIIQRLSGQVTTDGRVVGIFGYSPNYLALYLSPIAVLVATQSVRFQSRMKHLVYSILPELVFVIILVGIYLSGSRGGLLAVAGGLGTFVIFRYWFWIRERFSAKIMIVILILAALYTSWTLFKPNFSLPGSAGGRVVTSNNVRWQIWQTSLELGRDHPILGIGLANYQNAFKTLTQNRVNFPEYISPEALTSHNIYLMFYLTTGLLGLVAFLVLVVVFFREITARRSEFSPYLAAMMASILIYGFIDTPYWKNDLAIIFWVIWGLAWII